MREIIGVAVFAILISMGIKPTLDEIGAMSRAAADAETERYVAEELPGIIYNDAASTHFPKKAKPDAAIR